MSINKVFISGNLTRDAELRSTTSGVSLLTFGVAVNDRRKNQSGEWEDYANFIDCAITGKRAESLERYLKKGLKVMVEGKLRYSQWEDRNSGAKRTKIDVTVEEVEFALPKGGSDVSETVSKAFGSGAKVSAYNDEEIPF